MFALLCDYHHHPSLELFPSCRTEALPHSVLTALLPSPGAGSLHSAFCLCECDYSKDFMKVTHIVFVFYNQLVSFSIMS